MCADDVGVRLILLARRRMSEQPWQPPQRWPQPSRRSPAGMAAAGRRQSLRLPAAAEPVRGSAAEPLRGSAGEPLRGSAEPLRGSASTTYASPSSSAYSYAPPQRAHHGRNLLIGGIVLALVVAVVAVEAQHPRSSTAAPRSRPRRRRPTKRTSPIRRRQPSPGSDVRRRHRVVAAEPDERHRGVLR